MPESLLIGMTYNIGLLLALGLIYEIIVLRWHTTQTLFWQVPLGLILGVIGITVMLTPWEFTPGIIFDTRSILLSIAGLFFGTAPTAMAMAITAGFRTYLGGEGALTGVAVILASGLIGLAWRHFRKQSLAKMPWSELYLFGLVVHIVMLLLMLTLPGAAVIEVLTAISLPVLVVYPVGTAMLGALMVNLLRSEQTEEALKASEERFRLLFNSSNDAIYVFPLEEHNEPGNFVEVNDMACKRLGYTREELLTLSPAKINTEKNRGLITAIMRRLKQEGQVLVETCHLHRDGRVIPVEINARLFNFNGRPSVLSIVRDITERKRAEEDLREAVLRQDAAVRAGNVGLWDWNLETNRVHYSTEWKTQIGYEEHEIGDAFEEWQSRVHPDDLEPTLNRIREYITEARPQYQVEFRFRHKDNSYHWILAQSGVICDEAGRPIRVLGSYVDITEYKRAEEEIIRQHEALRGLAARLAEVEEAERQKLARELHDQVCQNLTMLCLDLEIIKGKASQESLDNLLSRITDVTKEIEHTNEITSTIMEGLRPTVLDHYGLLGGLHQLASKFSQQTGIAVDFLGDELTTRLDTPLELALFRITQEALANVAKHSKATQVKVFIEEKEGAFRLNIADNGIGFNQEKVVRPKEGKKWGLMVMTERAIAVGGHCLIESQPDQGTRVAVEVPR